LLARHRIIYVLASVDARSGAKALIERAASTSQFNFFKQIDFLAPPWRISIAKNINNKEKI